MIALRSMVKRKTFLNYFLLVLWMGVIFYLSDQPDLKSGLESSLDFILRKMAHITEYGILTFLAWRAFITGKETAFPKGSPVSGMPKFLIYAVIFSVFYAMSDEYHQFFVVGRVGSVVDVLIDIVGIIISGTIIRMRKIRE